MTTRITFNGKQYGSVDEMPPDVRRAFERAADLLKDEDDDGVPDIVQDGTGSVTHVQQTTYSHNGQEYNSIEEMPPQVRKDFERLMGPFDADGDGVPDALQLGRFSRSSVPTGKVPLESAVTTQPSKPVDAYHRHPSNRNDTWIILLLSALLISVIALIGVIILAVMW